MQRRKRHLTLESLEWRAMMHASVSLTSDGILHVTADPSGGEVAVGSWSGRTSVRSSTGGATAYSWFDLSDINKIVFRGSDAMDTFRNHTNIVSDVFGNGGNDWLSGGTSSDAIWGGNGNDRIFGNLGWDSLYGGAGHDNIQGGNGTDVIYGDFGPYVTLVWAQPGNDTIDGGLGDDTLFGEGGNDHLIGNYGNDVMYGGNGSDRVAGGSGHDRMYGGDGNDLLWGYTGNDTIDGGRGNDTIRGESGNDYLIGNYGNDTMEGGDGNDRIAGGSGHDVMKGGYGNDYMWGYSGDDTLEGNHGDDTLLGESGDDNLYGGAGADTLYGHSGNDGLFGGVGARDVLYGGTGADRFLQPMEQFRFFFINLQRDEDRLADFNGAVDAELEFWRDDRAWTEAQVRRVDEALALLHGATGNTRLLKDSVPGRGPLRFYRYDSDPGGCGNFACNYNSNHHIYVGNGTFNNMDNSSTPENENRLWAIQTILHEIGHNWDDPAENSTANSFRALSDWRRLPPGIGIWTSVGSYISASNGWSYFSTATFARDYGETNPQEDFATAFAAYFVDRAGTRFLGTPHRPGADVGADATPEKIAYMRRYVDSLS